MTDQLERLALRIRSYRRSRATVAFSGGVDSGVVLAVAARTLGEGAITAVTGISASYPAGELEQARAQARFLGVRHVIIETPEVEMDRYARNDLLRCFHCKTVLYGLLRQVAARADQTAVALAGTNADDAGDFRPGILAGERFSIRNPLLDERIDKPSVRAIAHRLGLSLAEKPALACLASRVAYGVRITPALLGRIDLAEQAVRGLGFEAVRVRHLGSAARIEVPGNQVAQLSGHPGLPQLVTRLGELGWDQVTIDPVGLQSGRLSTAVSIPAPLRQALTHLDRQSSR